MLQGVLARAGHLTDERNRLLHGVWGTELDGGPVVRGDDHNFRSAPSVGDLNDLEDGIAELLDEFVEARKGGFLQQALAKRPIP